MTTTSTRLGELVDRFGGQLIGSPDLTVTGIAPLSDAGQSHITFLSNSKLRQQAASTHAAALILTETDHAQISSQYPGACILTSNPYVYFARSAQYFASLAAIVPVPGIHPDAWVSPHAVIAPDASIGPHVSIEAEAVIEGNVVIHAGTSVGRGVRIGSGTIIHANASIYDYCELGQRCIIHSGAVIGADGFGFANERGSWIKIPQTGRVMIGDDVEVGANTSIDRGALADTIIENGVKLDNQIQIGHNCHIGEHTAMAGCVGVAGSAKIGKHCTFGGAAMVLGHLTIVDHVHISSGSMVSRSILEPGQYTGFYPLAKNADWEKTAAIVRNLSGMREKIRQLEKTIKTLTEKTS
ncbi:UDP-3-O-(3-hydroxymyristoyl)glucosamine N-acyltransferase [Undibacterium oligocarboniphilum]|uniref:UDP-3-O-acylglucosamine N-acyltransferase n=1 Tax=Undibacterium oligocarboniphilum TaxID=666702 RepID=A0A850QGV4_9BURK|nr:UDP-3-O-(3-hydroxymyristoyl)glucosamine N-acyltransferase [Undibacterium oligocarboniphilum]MBC3870378.1 UDP-3-O-(3-hydroxymyristoyl)glucosamine N-acyltransferase [Undibacterium oligocarboniphilum]NVO78369.1 UDP-3-O-(3-hydroxymyristoyl)glucosamine N-acyltransferase [Undibacterium oligocarboniphilum]